MVHRYRLATALTSDGLAADVDIAIDQAGDLVADTTGPAERVEGLVLPGLPNLHSHAFQRAMAGLAERAGPGGDSFWTWRETMYRFLGVLGPDDVEAIAAWLYVECLKHGYTAVGEFHYLHNAPDGGRYADPAELARRILAAAQASGIGLTLLPVLYQASQFGGAPPNQGQRRFVLDDAGFVRLMHDTASALANAPNFRLGLAPHSLRAVTPPALANALELADAIDPTMPRHIHAAEQTKEVADCVAHFGRRPVEWLLDRGLDPRWTLIHCTHMTTDERQRLAHARAVAGLCPTTEANLGDGLFPITGFIADGGRFGIGSDSNVSTSPVEELRWLEYGARLASRGRNVADPSEGTSTGTSLVRRALSGGAQALGRKIGALAPGMRADLVVLDTDHPALVGKPADRLLDSFVFSGNDTPVRHVMVGGRWLVRDGRHVDEDRLHGRFVATMRRLASAL